jgi:glycosyltransferase involved in cell wall biosynthesis
MMGLLHRQVWQRLPYGLRRTALFHGLTLAAPRPDPAARIVEPLVVAARCAPRPASASRRDSASRRCRPSGLAAGALDLTDVMRQQASVSAPAAERAAPGTGTLILHVNAPLVGLALLAAGRAVVQGKRIVGYWAWELPEVPAEWRLGVELVHEIWVPSAFTAAAVARIAGDRPVHVVPHPAALKPVPPQPLPAPGRPFTVLSVFDASSSLARKNPEGSIQAFQRAFGADPQARLVLKTQRLDTVPDAAARLRALAAAPNITLLDATLEPAQLDALYAGADVLLSLHRAEGFGLALAEAMHRGLTVVATGWSGNADFLTDAVGVPVPSRRVPAEDAQMTYHHPNLLWAEPDIDAAAEALRMLRAQPARRAQLGAAAAAFATAHWDARAYRARLRDIGVPV